EGRAPHPDRATPDTRGGRGYRGGAGGARRGTNRGGASGSESVAFGGPARASGSAGDEARRGVVVLLQLGGRSL
ncbi:MAG: hypothetical protein AVDCRST_MAG01-01-3876, partial [uncultured Rubrobacteraceae bacterium]